MRIKNGFTIIETSLVLAIAGLIFLLAFVALPALNRNQRDAKRKDDIMSLADNIKKYQSNNNRGALPSSETELNAFKSKYITSDFTDPDGSNYVLKYGDCEKGCATVQERPNIVFVKGANCGDGNKAVKSTNNRKAVLLYKLEVNDTFCFEL